MVKTLERHAYPCGIKLNYARFNLVTLSLIVAIARAGSISGGALQVNLAIAAASKRLGDFESEVRTQIFYRRPTGVELTEVGRTVLSDIMEVLEAVERLAKNMSEFSSGTRGHIRIWANPAAISDVLPEDIAAFAKLHPDVGLELVERDSFEIVKAVLENRADIGVFGDTVKTAGLQSFVYREDELGFVVPTNHPLTRYERATLLQSLDYPFVGLLARTPIAARLEYESARIGRTPHVKVQVPGVEAMCRMISAGLGIGILPMPTSARYLDTMNLDTVPIAEDWSIRQLFIGIRDHAPLASAARQLLEHLLTANSTPKPSDDERTHARQAWTE